MEKILFYDLKGKYGFCSNFFQKNVKIDGEIWLSTEQYFQAKKFLYEGASDRSKEYGMIIKSTDSPGKAKILGSMRKNNFHGKKWVVNKKTDQRLVNSLVDEYSDVKMRKDWEKVKVQIMINALIQKFADPDLKKKLTSVSDNAYFIEHTKRDKLWGDGGDGGTGKIGKNYLGKILTCLSHVLKYGNCEKMPGELSSMVKLK